jgi:hypothetical protein
LGRIFLTGVEWGAESPAVGRGFREMDFQEKFLVSKKE